MLQGFVFEYGTSVDLEFGSMEEAAELRAGFVS